MIVVGNPAAGIHEVWITYTLCPEPPFECNGEWVSLDLVQNNSDSTLWEEKLPLDGISWPDIRYMVQAVNGVGLVSLDTNLGAYYTPAFDMEPTMPTELVIQSIQPPGSGPYGTQATFLATLTSDEAPATLLSNQVVSFRLGSQNRQAVTDGSGNATVDMSLLALPGLDEVKASFAGTGDLIPSTATKPFTITKQITMITLDPPTVSVFPDEDSGIVATLSDVTGRRLGEKTVIFEITGENGTFSKAEITDYAGRAPLGPVPLPKGEYTVIVHFAQVAGDLNLADDRYESATTTGLLTLENRPPGIASDEATTNEDMAVLVDVLANDTDADDDILLVVDVIQPVHGLVVNNILNVTYTPDSDYCGSDAFTYTAGDGSGGIGTASVNLEISCVNDAPVAVVNSYSVDEDGVLDVLESGVLDNDTDVDGDVLSAALVSGSVLPMAP